MAASVVQQQPQTGLVVPAALTTDDPSGPCVAAIDSLIIRVTPAPAAPTILNTAVCTGNAATLVATAPGGTYEWFNVPSGGGLIATGTTFTSPPLSANTTYYVQSIINSCTGPRIPVTI